ncbi:GroES-like protein [Penicillium argentinense]|uniref:GroES-like protein n=1 Tax=Penicillium argentinense TaxID=1131581 RepID=A0A9W9KM78_9EURO|nr:GroES-like protein [Penicillium argentinense]KAJ5110597.1 GroES-like protein [Penicillium argentinense]
MPSQHAIVAEAPSRVRLVSNVEIPQPGEDEVLVKIHSIALNPVDWKTLAYSSTPGAISGCDFSGVVAGPVGAKCKRALREGERVCGWVMGANPLRPSNGSFAEYVAAKADLLYRIPENVTFENAATIGIGATTGGLALFKTLGLSFAERKVTPSSPSVLVYGGATSSGIIAIQLLRVAGYRVIAVCSSRNFGFVKDLGAEVAFDYHSDTCGKDIRAYTQDDLGYALDCISSTSSMGICYDALRSQPGAQYVSLDPFPDRVQRLRPEVAAEWILAFTVTGEEVGLGGAFHRDPTPEDYEFGVSWCPKIDRMLEEGKLHPQQPTVVEGGLAGVADGLERLKKGEVHASKLVYVL